MQTPFSVIQINNKQRREVLQNKKNQNRIFSTLNGIQHKILVNSSHSNQSRFIKSQESSRMSRSPAHQKQRSQDKKIFCATTRTKCFFDQKTQQSLQKKPFQISTFRQTLRRTQAKNKKNVQSVKSNLINQSRSYLNNKPQIEKQSLLDLFKEVEGTKCKICTPRRPKNSKSSRKSKSVQAKKQQLRILSDQQQNYNQVANYSNLRQFDSKSKFYDINNQKCGNNNKVKISTLNCFIFTGQMMTLTNRNNVCQSQISNNINPQYHNNFIRSKKKSLLLTKKVANFQKQEEEQNQRINQQRIISFKNNFGKCQKTRQFGYNQVFNTQRLCKEVKKQQYQKIIGWEINYPQDGQGVLHNQTLHFK